jgi:DNA-binding NarL/FixJ family response regulator
VLVDDVPHVRLLVRTALRVRDGFEVVGEAGDGSGAVRLAAELRPDIVVLDLGLPDIAGQDVLTRVREGSPDSKIVVFSGTEAPEIAERVEGYVLKDADIDYLIDLLETVGQGRSEAVVLALPAHPTSVSRARRFLRSTLHDWNLEQLVEDGQIVVSELVTNAVTHAKSAPELRLSLKGSTLRVEVRDDGTGTPQPQPPSETGEHGRGMHLVAALAAAWGMDVPRDDGKVVWAELAH